MARYKRRPQKRKLIIFPLMDMFFILLVFYLMIHHGRAKPIKQEVFLPYMDNIGEANAILQVTDDNGYLWLDSAAIDNYIPDRQRFMRRLRITEAGLDEKISGIWDLVENPTTPYYAIMIRCPDRMSYREVNRLIDKFTGDVDIGEAVKEKLIISVAGGNERNITFSRGEEDYREYIEVNFND